MLKILYYICLSAVYSDVLAIIRPIPEPNPDVGLRVPELIRKYNYPFEEHTVTTKDGYILTMHRIPHGKHNPNATKLPVVFIMHGLICSSGDWIIMGPEKGLGYIMADRGYDVWMGNARGNTYSTKHIKLDPHNDRREFWDFSWHEIGIYDLPAMIDYTLNITGEEKLFYMGHSQGCTSFLVMTSMLPEYNDKIRLMIGMATVAYMSHMANKAYQLISQFNEAIEIPLELIGHFNFYPSTKLFELLGQATCNDESIFQEVCANILFLMLGYDSEQLNRTMLPVIFSNVPAGSSTKQFIHYSQLIKHGLFRQFDYGIRNPDIYGQLFPPEYNLRFVTAPIVLAYGINDKVCSEEDTVILSKKLKNHVLYKVPYDKFNHIDFLWGTRVVELVYEMALEMFQKY